MAIRVETIVTDVLAFADDLIIPYTEKFDGTRIVAGIASVDACDRQSLVFVDAEPAARTLLESCPALLITTGALAELIISLHESPDDLNIAITANPRLCMALIRTHLDDYDATDSE